MLRQRISFVFLISFVIIFLFFDLNLFKDIQNIKFDQNTSSAFPPITAKHVMLDHVNSYVMSPLSLLLDDWLHVTSRLTWLTANHVSFLGVVVALVAARVALSTEHARLAVLVFLFRQFLDDFDGLVARVRRGIERTRDVSITGTSGYAVDGFCDAIGFSVFLCAVAVANVRKARNQNKYKLLNDFEARGEHVTTQREKETTCSILRDHVLFGLQMLLSCVLWNRYIDLFHRLIEEEPQSPIKVQLFKSRLQWLIMWAWRCVGNAHQLMNFFLVSIWFQRSLYFVQKIRLIGFLVILALSLLTEVHVHDIETYLKSVSNE